MHDLLEIGNITLMFKDNIRPEIKAGLNIAAAASLFLGTACGPENKTPEAKAPASPSSRTIPAGSFEVIVKGLVDKTNQNLGARLFRSPHGPFDKQNAIAWLPDGAQPLVDCKTTGETFTDPLSPDPRISSNWYRVVADSNGYPFKDQPWLGEAYASIPPATEIPACTPTQVPKRPAS